MIDGISQKESWSDQQSAVNLYKRKVIGNPVTMGQII